MLHEYQLHRETEVSEVMNDPVCFDRQKILSMVEALRARGARLPRVYSLVGGVIGFMLGLARNPLSESAFWWAVPMCVAVLCAGIGRIRGQMMNFNLNLQGQNTLCQLELTDSIRRLTEATSELSRPDAPVKFIETECTDPHSARIHI
jgi:hypothetical protein